MRSKVANPHRALDPQPLRNDRATAIPAVDKEKPPVPRLSLIRRALSNLQVCRCRFSATSRSSRPGHGLRAKYPSLSCCPRAPAHCFYAGSASRAPCPQLANRSVRSDGGSSGFGNSNPAPFLRLLPIEDPSVMRGRSSWPPSLEHYPPHTGFAASRRAPEPISRNTNNKVVVCLQVSDCELS